MCGIAGFVDFTGRPAAEWAPVLDRMHRAIAHRGPDDAGQLLLGADVEEFSASGRTRSARLRASGATVGFAHARLSILDLSPSGHQPMAAPDRSAWVTYNGEIYNYRTLRDELAAQGERLCSRSDTEVLVRRLAAGGPAALVALRGMFAIAWWDDRAERLVLARDRFGLKPLVYTRPSAGVVLFASLPRALMASGLLAPRAAPERVAEFLTRGSIGSAASFWEGVHSVPPAASIEIDRSTEAVRRYWSLDEAMLAPGPETDAAAVARVAEGAIVDSVRAHLVSDVPVAIFLSGGLDSTALLAAARASTTGSIQTFTVSMPGLAIDETAAARESARRFGSDHLEVSAEDHDTDAALDEFFAAMPAPSVDGFNTFLVARAARQAGLKVALSGVGGDELFGGYDSFAGAPRVAALCRSLGAASPIAARLARLWPSPHAGKLGTILAARPRTLSETWWEYRRLFAEADVRQLAAVDGPRAPVLPGEAPDFSAIRLFETRHFLEAQLLGDADAFTMCRALELRTPLVDHVLVGAIVGAGRWPRRSGESHKQTLFRELPSLTVPGAVARPKQGFVLPYDAWIREALASKSPRRLRDLAGRLRQPRYAPFVTRFAEGRLHWSRLWALYVLERLTADATTWISRS